MLKVQIERLKLKISQLHDGQWSRTMEAEQIAHGLIQGYIGSDHRVIDMANFYRALVQALEAARQRGWNDCAGGTERSL